FLSDNGVNIIKINNLIQSLYLCFNYSPSDLATELEKKINFTDEDYNKKIITLYDLFPSAVFIGTKNISTKNKKGVINCILCAHGGLEPGFDPKPLLLDKRSFLYQKITCLNLDWLKSEKKLHAKLSNLIKPNKKPKAEKSGLAQSDFIVGDKGVFQKGDRGYLYDQQTTKEIWDTYNQLSAYCTVMAMTRGHQHNGKMLVQMKLNHGIYNSGNPKQWNGKKSKITFNKKYPIFTINVTPESTYGYNYKETFGHVTYLSIETAQKFKKWKFRPKRVKIK
ncbi:hypothetical protein ACFLYA_02650, partial [Candidatus Dependentiae bacterium]